jgi:hypothetical protein
MNAVGDTHIGRFLPNQKQSFVNMFIMFHKIGKFDAGVFTKINILLICLQE